MKRLLTIILVFCFAVSYSQTIVNRAGQANTVSDARLQAQYNFYLPRYNDTIQANLTSPNNKGIDSCGAKIYTRNPQAVWQRFCSPKRWVRVLDVTNLGGQFFFDSTCNCFKIDSNLFQFFNYDSTCNCFVLDTAAFNNYITNIVDTSGSTNSITNIYNSSITNVTLINGDSCAVLNTGSGVHIDTFCFGFKICSFGFSNDHTFYACSCADSINITPTCDTVTFTPHSIYVFQQWVQQPSLGIVEGGGTLGRDIAYDGNYFNAFFNTRKVQDYGYKFNNYQSWGNSGGIISFNSQQSSETYLPSLGIFYTGQPQRTDGQGGYIAGWMGTGTTDANGSGRKGYMQVANGIGQIASNLLYAQDKGLKTVGIMYNFRDTGYTDAIRMFGIEANAGSGPGSTAASAYARTFFTGHTTGRIQFNRYANNAFQISDSGRYKPAVIDTTDGSIKQGYWFGGGGGFFAPNQTSTGNTVHNANGFNFTVNGMGKLAIGNNAVASGVNATALGGRDITASGTNSFVGGGRNGIASGTGSVNIGTDGTASGDYSLSANDANSSKGESSSTFGFGNSNWNTNALVAGSDNILGALTGSGTANLYSGGFMWSLNGRSIGNRTLTLGNRVQTQGDDAMAIGTGTGTTTLKQRIPNALGIGFKSDTSTFIIYPGAGGVGTFDTTLINGVVRLGTVANNNTQSRVMVWDSLNHNVEYRDALSLAGGSQTLQQVFNTEVGGSVLTKTDSIQVGSNALKIFGTTGNSISYLGSGLFQSVNNSAATAILGVSNANGTAISGLTTNGLAGGFTVAPSSTNTVIPIIAVVRETTGTAADGIGGEIKFSLTTSLGDQTSNELISKWTTANLGTRTSEFSITGVSNGATNTLIKWGGGGAPQYSVNADSTTSNILSVNSKYIQVFTTGSAATWTLPAIGNIGLTFIIKNIGTASITLNSKTGGNDIYTGSAVSSLTINPGESYTLTDSGTYFIVY